MRGKAVWFNLEIAQFRTPVMACRSVSGPASRWRHAKLTQSPRSPGPNRRFKAAWIDAGHVDKTDFGATFALKLFE
ncbi:hypothetical protein KIN_29370 [Litoreibacter roseus]|uniref:Uncharacterized protein n=1 Tax=Litoreibacter roseus TaxID=2601869 RepID=A0A6N6JHM7_9RHOB|nr:hypothetical protein KIN_29370 [Litoreibacter roseus]